MSDESGRQSREVGVGRTRPRLVWGAVLVAALLTATIHMVPYWHASASVRPGWSFTGALRTSQDMMQYRAWLRHTRDGPLVKNRLTTEPHRPYLVLPFQYVVGRLADLTGMRPETTYHIVGAGLAFGLTVLIFMMLRTFLGNPGHALTVLLMVMFGGGLTAHVRVLSRWIRVGPWQTIARDIGFEGQRTAWPVTTLTDTHFLFVWLIITAAVLAFHRAVREPRPRRLVLAALLFAVVTISHPYESALLGAICVGVCLALWLKRLPLRSALLATFWCLLATAVTGVGWLTLYLRSGLPVTNWTQDPIPPSILVLMYPIPVLVLGWGIGRYWKGADADRTFLLGWAFGSLGLVLSAPFFPYPVRGLVALQIPLYAMAGIIFYDHRNRLGVMGFLVVVLFVGLTPVRFLQDRWRASGFREDRPEVFVHDEQRHVIDVLAARARSNDVLLAAPTAVRWLGPEYPGRLYLAHWFMTVDYVGKLQAVNRFFDSDPAFMASFLEGENIRFVFSDEGPNPRLEAVEGVQMLANTRFGTLYEWVPHQVSDEVRRPQ